MSIVFTCPWYATMFRADTFADALAEIAPVALRYGASDYAVYRAGDDRSRFTQYATFETKYEIEPYWHGEEFSAWRARYGSWYQVPVVYNAGSLVTAGKMGGSEGNGNGGAAASSAQAEV